MAEHRRGMPVSSFNLGHLEKLAALNNLLAGGARNPLVNLGRFGYWAVSAIFIVIALCFAWTTLCAIINFGWRQPMFDQWGEYEIFLGYPFPLNALQDASGHRPIFPNLLGIAEIQWLHANQYLQLSVGAGCAYAIAIIVAVVSWKEKTLPVLARCAAVMLAVLGVLWLGNARRLLHGSEALHGYLPTLAVVAACLWTWSSARRHSLPMLCAACVACIVATFSFGVGLAGFACVLALGWMLRLPPRWLLLPAATLGICFVLYVFVLPGGQIVRAQISLNLAEGLVLMTRWLASPWCQVWLNLADYGPGPWPGHTTVVERLLQRSAAGLVAITGLDWHALGGVIGFAGMLLLAWYVLPRLIRKKPLSRLEALSSGLAIYAFGSAILSVFPRIGYLRALPGQIYADRYTAWPCLFWLGLSLLALSHVAKSPRLLPKIIGTVALFLPPMVMAISQGDQTIWGQLVYRSSQRAAASLRTGVFDETHFTGENMGAATHMRQAALLREHGLAMFADDAWRHIGEIASAEIEQVPSISAHACWLDPVIDYPTQRPAGHLEGVITQGKSKVRADYTLAILNEDQRIAGLAEFSFIAANARAAMFRISAKRGFDGYVRDFDPAKKYTIALLHSDMRHGVALGPIKPRCK